MQVPAITSGGGISAEWVMVGITTVAVFLFWRILWKIENNLEKVIGTVAIHETKLQLHEKAIEHLEERL